MFMVKYFLLYTSKIFSFVTKQTNPMLDYMLFNNNIEVRYHEIIEKGSTIYMYVLNFRSFTNCMYPVYTSPSPQPTSQEPCRGIKPAPTRCQTTTEVPTST